MTPPLESADARAAPDTVHCARCSRVWPAEAWQALPKLATLTGADVQGYVSVWPADTVVEVRACGGCGGAIARRRVLRSK